MAESIVLDSSIAGKWFLRNEDGIEEADKILLLILSGAVQVHCPRVFLYEVCTLISKARSINKTQVPRLSAEEIESSIRELHAVASNFIFTDPSADECVKAAQYCNTYSKVFNDMCFLLLAESLDCKWYTADKKLLSSNRAVFPVEHIHVIDAQS
jgi:predicted nucleic acid-binding protein